MTIYKEEKQYCVYLTIYSGNKLPPFYIGSSSVKKINNGYHGSVSSKKYKHIWREELKNNPHLFKTKIIYASNDRKICLEKEFTFHSKLNVVKSPLYINMSLASKNGFFGMDTSGKNHPKFGKPVSEETKQLLREFNTGNHMSEESKLKLSNTLKSRPHHFRGKPLPDSIKEKISIGNTGKIRSEDTKNKTSETLKGKAKTLEHVLNMSNAKKGDKNYMYGKTHTDEAKKKISLAGKGRLLSETARQNISNGKLGDKNPSYGKTWWTNGEVKMLSVECPCEGFYPGMKLKWETPSFTIIENK